MKLKTGELAYILGVSHQAIYKSGKKGWGRSDVLEYIKEQEAQLKEMKERASLYGVRV